MCVCYHLPLGRTAACVRSPCPQSSPPSCFLIARPLDRLPVLGRRPTNLLSELADATLRQLRASGTCRLRGRATDREVWLSLDCFSATYFGNCRLLKQQEHTEHIGTFVSLSRFVRS